MTDGDKLRLLARWFDLWDAPETDRQAILDDARNPGKNDVQTDLRRMADIIETLSAERLADAIYVSRFDTMTMAQAEDLAADILTVFSESAARLIEEDDGSTTDRCS